VGTIIGLDLGTTTIVGVLLDADLGKVLCLARRCNDAHLQPVLPTRAEQDPRRLRVLVLDVLSELAAPGGLVDGIAMTGQKHGLLCADADGQPLTPLVSWQDQRTAEPLSSASTTLDQIRTRTADLRWQHNGCRLAHGYGAATLFWLVLHDELPPATHRVYTIADWMVGQLIGHPSVTDPTLAASWGVYSLVDNAWNAAFLERLGLELRLFPPVRPSGEWLGGLAPPVARQVGLPAGLPVYNALGDTQASFIGSVADPEETILFNLGTGGQICWSVPHFEPPSDTVEIRPLPPGRYLRVGASLCGGAAYAWLNRTVRAWLAEFGVEADEEQVYERLNALARAAEGTAGLRVQTTFLGVRGDPATRAGAIEGITPENLRLGALARATLAGIVDELHSLYRAHARETTQHKRLVAAGGGVVKNPLLSGLIEKQFGLPVEMSQHEEAAAEGAAATTQPPCRPNRPAAS
jgi:sedoheptulokinase